MKNRIPIFKESLKNSGTFIMIGTNILTSLFLETRQYPEDICKQLEIEDYVVQPIVDVSRPKWHLGHTSWFFEKLILKPFQRKFSWSSKWAWIKSPYLPSRQFTGLRLAK